MNGQQERLDRLMGRIEEDSPDLSQQEILALLERTGSSRKAGTVQANYKRSLTRGALIMSALISLIALVVFFHTTSQPPIQQIVAQHDSAVAAENTQRGENSPLSVESKIPLDEDASYRDSLRKQIRPLPAISMERQTFLEPTKSLLQLLGIASISLEHDREIVLYGYGNKIGFPEKGRSHQYDRDEVLADSAVLKYVNLKHYPEYVTDSRGNLIMIFKHRKIKNGSSTMRNLIDQDMAGKLEKNYFPTVSQTITGGSCDSLTNVFTARAVIHGGIMRQDTILRMPCDDQLTEINRQTFEIQQKLIFRDSTLKVSLGGERQIAKDFALELDPQSASPLQKRILTIFDRIDREETSDMMRANRKKRYVSALIDSVEDIPTKLRLEQLGRKYDYEVYVLQSKEQEEELKHIGDLIPIKIRNNTGMRDDGKYDSGLIFWYQPTSELLALLPATIAKIHENRSNAFEVRVSPNPAMMYAFVEFEVPVNSQVSMSMLDLTGREVTSDKWFARSNRNREEINLAGVESGIYILVLEKGGVQVTKQVVVRK